MVWPDQKSVEPVTIVNFKVAETKELKLNPKDHVCS